MEVFDAFFAQSISTSLEIPVAPVGFFDLIPLLPCLDIPCSNEYQSPCNRVGFDTGIQCDNHVIFSVENY